MSFPLTALAPQLNAQNFANLSLSADPITNAAASLLDKVALNPQPLPPKELGQAASRFAQVAINPQPLPPGGGDHSGASKFADDWCGTVPHTLPHFPPNPPGPWGDIVSSALAFR